MRKGQQSVLEKANEYMMSHYGNELTEAERKLLMNEKWKVSFYKQLYWYIISLRKENRTLEYEEMLSYVDVIYEKGFNNVYMFFHYTSIEDETTLLWLINENLNLIKDCIHIFGWIYYIVKKDNSLSIKNVLEYAVQHALLSEDSFRYLFLFESILENSINSNINLDLVDSYCMSMKDMEQETLNDALREVRNFLKNGIDAKIAKRFDFSYTRYLFDKYKDKREALYEFYPTDDTENCYSVLSSDYKFVNKKDEEKLDVIKGLDIDCDVKMSIYKEKYEYRPTGLSVSLMYYDSFHVSRGNNYIIPSTKASTRIDILFSFTTEYPIAIYIKKFNKWVPASAKDLALYCYKNHDDERLNNLIDCIENVFLTYNRFFIKDVMEYIRSGRFIPPLILNDVYNYTDFNQIFGYKYPCPKNWNKNDINALYCAYKLRKFIEPVHQNLIFEIIDKDLLDKSCIKNISFRTKKSTRYVLVQLVSMYLYKKTNIFLSAARDYVTMCYLMNEKIKLGVKSSKKIIEEHDRLTLLHVNESRIQARGRKNPSLIVKNSKFTNLRKLLPKDEFEWIKREKRLDAESVIQHNCVWSYADSIKRDKCAIYHFVYQPENDAYTIEFHADKKGGYKIAQMQRTCNEGHSAEAYQYVNSFLQKSKNESRT